ncbi:glycosyl hydrolase family 28-related protein [Verrucomicrobiaceae bacterium 227]
MKFQRMIVVLILCLSSALSQAILDLDGNGYSDIWERKYKATNLAPFQDQDGDGEVNLAEHFAGTDPFDDQSVFTRAESRELFYNQNVVGWQSVSGVNYVLEESETLQPSGWRDSGGEIAGSGEIVWARSQTALDRSFFRVKIASPDSRLAGIYASELASDTDGDGVSDWNEWAMQTDIFNSDSRMATPSLRVLDGVGIRWASQPGKHYQIESRTIGAGYSWEDFGPIRLGTGSEMEAVLPFEDSQARIYSMRVLDVDSDGDGLSDWEENILGFRPDLTHTDHLGDGDYNEAIELLNEVNRVTFSAPVAIANVTRGIDGSLEVKRVSGIDHVEIPLTVDGDATPGVDYGQLPASVTLPFGQKSITIPVQILAGASVAIVEEVRVTLMDSYDYRIEGDIEQTIHLVSENVVNVRDYGAVGDGVTDDRAAIQAAINALENDPDQNTLYFPDGRYNLASYLSDSRSPTSRNRILKLGSKELAGRDLIFSFDPDASLHSSVSPIRAHILECEAKFRSLSFYNAQIEKDDVVLEPPLKAEPNGADGVSLVMHDLREVKMVQFLNCRFYNCHGAVSTYGSGFDTRGKLQYFRVQDCEILNPWGANSTAEARIWGGGQVVNILPWVGTAEYIGNYFDGGSEVEGNISKNPLDRKKDGSHFGSPLRLIFKRNIIDHMRVEAVYQLHNPLMGYTSEEFDLPMIGEETTVNLREYPSTYRVGDKIAIRGELGGMGVKSVSFTVVSFQAVENELTIRNDGDNDFLLDTLTFSAVKPIYLQGEHNGEALIIDNVVRALNSDGRRSSAGIVTASKATVRGNYVEGYGVGIQIYGNARTPLSPASRGTLIEDNIIYTAEGLVDGFGTYGVQSWGVDDMIRENLIITPISTRVVGIALRGKNTVARYNTLIAEKAIPHGYTSSSRAVGVGVGNSASIVRIEENTTRGFEVGVGPVSPSQSIPYYASGNLSFGDVLPQDVRGLIVEE